MAIYLSAGASTIAALIAIDRVGLDQSRAEPVEPNNPRSAEASAGAANDFSQIRRSCERAVVIAYCDLRALGTDDLSAFRACTVLYHIHHPETPMQEARHLVATWIDHHVVVGQRGPTPGCDCD